MARKADFVFAFLPGKFVSTFPSTEFPSYCMYARSLQMALVGSQWLNYVFNRPTSLKLDKPLRPCRVRVPIFQNLSIFRPFKK